MRVLLVDDEAAFARPLAERLELRGMEAGVALDAEAALVMLAGGEWDLVFLDVGLPGMDGVTLLKILRERYPDLDVVMLSGAADMGRAVQAMRRGARNWLSKPVSVDGVLAECAKARDRAQARRQAARLAEAARLRSLGRVAEGVAHEVNNPLNIMVQAAGLIKDSLDDPEAAALPELEELRAAVDTIRAQSLRVREITRKLLMVGHGLDARVQPLDVPEILARVLELTRSRLDGAGVRCELDFPPETRAARPPGSALELQQICLHLVENALDAMTGGGLLRIAARVRREEGDAAHAGNTTRGGEERGWYELRVADSGHGIAPDVLPHIFEPFFSTRESCGSKGLAGRYAGLGLTVARSLAHGRGYELTAANGADGGAVFTLSLPLGTDAVSI